MPKGIKRNKVIDIINNLESDEEKQNINIKYRIFDAKDEEIFEGMKDEIVKYNLLDMYVNQYEEIDEINGFLLTNIYLEED